MKKIASFITAFIIFAVIVVVFHFAIRGSLQTHNKAFGTWVNMYKDLSYEAVAENIGKDTMMVFGSSEFNHGKKLEYHPANLFKKQNVDLMIIGGAYNQSLSHAIKLGAVENKLVKRKAVLILSPTWFYAGGVKPDNYDLRFSESDYMALMENGDISKKTKQYIASRSELLLKNDGSMLHRVERCNEIFLEGKDNFWNRSVYNFRKMFVHDRNLMTVKAALKASGIKKKKHRKLYPDSETLNWDKLAQQARKKAVGTRNFRFGMNESTYNSQFKNRVKSSFNSHIKDSFARSPEYDDLRSFLDICKETKVEVMLVIQPLNGYWYDNSGLTLDKRQVFKNNILKIADTYKARVADFSDMEYSKYYFQDAVHPDGEGWVKINEKIYEFYE